jgi:hypothetical protein
MKGNDPDMPAETRIPTTVFFLVRASAEWLKLNPTERNGFVSSVLRPILQRYPEVRLRYFDAEAYSADVSDVLEWEFASDRAYEAVVESLRETPFWNHYFEVLKIIRCVKDGFARHYGIEGFGGKVPN